MMMMMTTMGQCQPGFLYGGHEQHREETLMQQQRVQVKAMQEEQQRHLREEQERLRTETEKQRAEAERIMQEEETKRMEIFREQERKQEALRAEQMRLLEEVKQAQLRVQQEQELQNQQKQLEQHQKMLQEQAKQQELLRLERLRLEEEQKRQEKAARQEQERIKREEVSDTVISHSRPPQMRCEMKRQELLRYERLRQEQFATLQQMRENALAEKRRQEQLLIEQQQRLQQQQARAQEEKRKAAERLQSESMQREIERLAEEVRAKQDKLRLAQEEIQREKEKMANELMREQQRIQEERQRLKMEHEKLQRERAEREKLGEENRTRLRQHQDMLLKQHEVIGEQQQVQVQSLRQQHELLRAQQGQPIASDRRAEDKEDDRPMAPMRHRSQAVASSNPVQHTTRAARPPATTAPDRGAPMSKNRARGGGGGHGQPRRLPRIPKQSTTPTPIPKDLEQANVAEVVGSFEAYAAQVARKHRLMDPADLMTADKMFDSSGFEEKICQFDERAGDKTGEHTHSSYYSDSDDEGTKSSALENRTSHQTLGLGGERQQKQQAPAKTLSSHKTGPASTSERSAWSTQRTGSITALRTGPAGVASNWDTEKEEQVDKKPRGIWSDDSVETCVPMSTSGEVASTGPALRLPPMPRRRSTGQEAEGDENNREENVESGKKKDSLIALAKHSTDVLKRTTRQNSAPNGCDTRAAVLASKARSLNAQRPQEQEVVVAHSAPLPRAGRKLPPIPGHISPPAGAPIRAVNPVPDASQTVKHRPSNSSSNLNNGNNKPLPPVIGQRSGGGIASHARRPMPTPQRAKLSPEAAALIFQTRWRGARMRRQYNLILFRSKVAKEIYSSELVYVQSLGVTVDVFLKSLRRAVEKGKPIILPNDIEAIFGNLEAIYAYHLQLVSKLEARISKWNVDTQIGDTFLDMKEDFIQLYSVYITHYDQALETINRCQELKSWKTFILRCNQHPECGGLSLEAFLILPVQRVTRYVILLRDLTKKTATNHVDYNNIKAAHAYMDNICYQVNESKRRAENLRKQLDTLTSLQAKMKPKDMVQDLVDESRVFIRQDVLTLYDQDTDKRRVVFLFLFNDMLLITKGDARKDRFQVMAKFMREDHVRLEIMADTDDFMGQQIKNAFVLHTPRISYLFFCSSLEERGNICDCIRAIYNR